MAPSAHLKVIEQCRIMPSSSISGMLTSLPLTFFDIVFLRFPPVQRLFFYDYRGPIPQFIATELPKLKHALALSLHLFYPLAGTLRDAEKPVICCSDADSVSLTVAVCNADFDELSAGHSRPVTCFHPLVPPLVSSGDRTPVFAVQVTVFPNTGISIGTTVHHAVADGSAYTHFMKTWASMCRDSTGLVCDVLPIIDRTMVRDPIGLRETYVDDLNTLEDGRGSLEVWDLLGQPNVVRATFVFRRETLDALGRKTSTRCSPYALACGYVWSCLARTRRGRIDKTERFGFVTGCRARLDPPLPAEYFGNCLGICRVEARRADIVSDDGAANAAEAIWGVISGLSEGVLAGAENWIRDVFEYASAKALTVAGSPKLGIYGVDFGWGRPRKVELISIERTGALSLAERRDEAGGIEVGLALPRDQMEDFVTIFGDGLSLVQ